ncbi:MULTISPECIES: AraC family transcriptional regulator [Nocardiopsis]|uniref:AraC family transcriptional regulator n=1 Tax=Nocardiopsis lambiniae TaxID=3075539 RepID=A0ABU2MFK3_9ACTN|nr:MULTISPECIES: AraC family transcriptional regulator [unclassified Nocardiopsis]MDE3721309.1 AraC family transcriptional regulator [Nocardiopsis sp. N85]MDT0330651.1 AraC family transcriptional regulator [Nocardiopsis sp. DSM 44743]
MDPLAHLLDGPRARGAFTLRVVMRPPWGIRLLDGSSLTLIVVTSGRVWVDPGDGGTEAREGDVVLMRGPDPYTLTDARNRPPSITVLPGQRCFADDGTEVHVSLHHGIGTWGNDPDGPDTLIVGAYEDDSEVGRLALAALPRLAVLPGDRVDPALVSLLSREITSARVAQSGLNDRLLDCLLVMAVRAWIEDTPDHAPSWLNARHDPVVARALELIHEQPAEPWTLAGLARVCAVSRSTLADRFQRAVGTPPMTYLRTWRLTVAGDLLTARPDLGLEAVAARVGYGSAFAFSAAFKQHTGLSPSLYRSPAAS